MANQVQKFSLVCLLLLSGCGTSVPQLHEAWETADVQDHELVYRIKKSIYCELRTAIGTIGPRQDYFYRGQVVDNIPDNWGTQMTLSLQVDEKGSLSPSGSYNQTLRPTDVFFAGRSPVTIAQSFALPMSAEISSQATRIDRYYSFFSVKDLKKPFIRQENSCSEPIPGGGSRELDRHGSSFLLSGDLGIAPWLKSAIRAQNAIPSSPFPKSQATKLDVLQYNVKFLVITGGGINPTWRMVNLSTGTGALPLLSGSRIRIHDLLLTLGPTDLTPPTATARATVVPSPAAANLHLEGAVQQAISNGLRSVLAP